MSDRRTIARNTVFNALGRFSEALLGLVFTWYVVNALGKEGWGLWSLVAAFTGYASLLDLGVASGFTKFVAEHHGRKDAQSVSAVLSTGLFFYSIFGVVLVAVGWPLIGWLAPIIAGETTGDRLAELVWLFRGALVLFAINNALASFAAVPNGIQRMGLSNALSAGTAVVKLVVVVLFLEAGFGILGVLYTSAVTLACFGVASLALTKYLLPEIQVRPCHVSRATFRQLFGYGWRTQVAKFSNLINFQTDRVVVATLLGDLALVGLFRLGEELAGKVRQVPALLVTALLPAASDLDARKEDAALARLYVLSTKYMALASVPLTLYVLVWAEPLMRAWMGDLEGLDTAADILRLLALGYLANLVAGPGVSVVLGKGRADVPMVAGLLSTGSNIVLTIVLWYAMGLYGIALATSLGMILSTIWFFAKMRRIVDVPVATVLGPPFLWLTLASLPGVVLGYALMAWTGPQTGHALNLALSAAGGALFGVAFLIALCWTPFLTAYDVTFLEESLGLGRVPGFAAYARRARDA